MPISAIVPGLEVAQVKGRHLVEVVSLAFEVPVPLLFMVVLEDSEIFASSRSVKLSKEVISLDGHLVHSIAGIGA